jgi:hypothetical protein
VHDLTLVLQVISLQSGGTPGVMQVPRFFSFPACTGSTCPNALRIFQSIYTWASLLETALLSWTSLLGSASSAYSPEVSNKKNQKHN